MRSVLISKYFSILPFVCLCFYSSVRRWHTHSAASSIYVKESCQRNRTNDTRNHSFYSLNPVITQSRAFFPSLPRLLILFSRSVYILHLFGKHLHNIIQSILCVSEKFKIFTLKIISFVVVGASKLLLFLGRKRI